MSRKEWVEGYREHMRGNQPDHAGSSSDECFGQLRKAAEAVIAIKTELRAMYPLSAGYTADEIRPKQEDLKTALIDMRDLLDPATVLELLRLAKASRRKHES